MYKLVPEHINEVLSFKRDQENSLANLGVGKIHLIKSWLDEMGITNYVINDDLTIDVNSDVELSYIGLVKFLDYINFNKVYGYFDCSGNQLTSLKGCPNYINGSFFCNNNQLTNLKGCPTYVGGTFWCFGNKKQFTEDDVKQHCNVKGNIYIK